MKKNCSIVFTGDIGFDRYMDHRWDAEDLLSPSILDYFKSADHVVANVEGAMIDANDDGSRGVFFHTMNPEARIILEKINADIWNISNNHIMDAGLSGLTNTIRLANEMGSQTIGAGTTEAEASQPIYLQEAGGIGMFGVAYQKECIPATGTEPGVFRWDNEVLITKRIQEIKANCRWCIVVAHGGEEFADLPNPYTRDRYIHYLELGADIVVSHHPHVAENYELFEDGKMIFYSLGNFIFDTDYQRAHMYTDRGVLLKLIFTADHVTFDALGTRIVRGPESIEASQLPAIFTNIPADEYELLSPFASDSFIKEEMKKMVFLESERFKNASMEDWNAYFNSEEPDGYDKGKHMDLSIVVPHASKVKKGAWKKSTLEAVKQYILARGNTN